MATTGDFNLAIDTPNTRRIRASNCSESRISDLGIAGGSAGCAGLSAPIA